MIKLALGIVVGALAAWLAKRRGYNPVIWFFAGQGLLGLLVIFLFPSPKQPNITDDERAKRIKNGNIGGFVLIGLGIFLAVIVAIVEKASR